MENAQANHFNTVDEYLATLTDDRKKAIMEQLRTVIKQAVPEADELISYQMPAYRYHGILIYFGAWKSHWAIYPASATIKATLKKDLSNYKQTKGAIQFPWDQPFPETLITKLVKKRREENIEKARTKGTSSKK